MSGAAITMFRRGAARVAGRKAAGRRAAAPAVAGTRCGPGPDHPGGGLSDQDIPSPGEGPGRCSGNVADRRRRVTSPVEPGLLAGPAGSTGAETRPARGPGGLSPGPSVRPAGGVAGCVALSVVKSAWPNRCRLVAPEPAARRRGGTTPTATGSDKMRAGRRPGRGAAAQGASQTGSSTGSARACAGPRPKRSAERAAARFGPPAVRRGGPRTPAAPRQLPAPSPPSERERSPAAPTGTDLEPSVAGHTPRGPDPHHGGHRLPDDCVIRGMDPSGPSPV